MEEKNLDKILPLKMNKTLETFDPILKILQHSRIFIFKFTKNGHLKLSKSSLIHIIIINCLIVFFTFLRFSTPELYNMEGSPASKLTLAITFMFGEIYYEILFVCFTIHRKSLVEILRRVDGINEKVKKNQKRKKSK